MEVGLSHSMTFRSAHNIRLPILKFKKVLKGLDFYCTKLLKVTHNRNAQ